MPLLREQLLVQQQRGPRVPHDPFASAKARLQPVVDVEKDLRTVHATSWQTLLRTGFNSGHEAVVGRQYGHIPVLAHLGIQAAPKRLQQTVQLQHMVVRQARLRAVSVVDIVMARQADGKDVGCLVLTQLFAVQCSAREVQRQRICEGSAQQ